eukprot:3881769-Alexandrium_andersonii.AAC.1
MTSEPPRRERRDLVRRPSERTQKYRLPAELGLLLGCSGTSLSKSTRASQATGQGRRPPRGQRLLAAR